MACSTGTNALFVSRPTQQMANNCGANEGCGQGMIQQGGDLFAPVSYCSGGKIGPRKSREAVREKLKEAILLRLGAPVVRVELTDQQLDFCVDYAMDIFQDYAPREYFNYYTFNTVPGKSVYSLPPEIALIRSVSYNQMPNPFFGSSDVGGALPLEYFSGTGGGAGSYGSVFGGVLNPTQPIFGETAAWTNYSSYLNMYSKFASQVGGWEWIAGACNIKLYPACSWRACQVIVHYLQAQYDFKKVSQVLLEGSFAFALEILGRVRGKYTQIPSAQAGGVTLDSPALLAQSEKLLEKWQAELISKYGDILPISLG